MGGVVVSVDKPRINEDKFNSCGVGCLPQGDGGSGVNRRKMEEVNGEGD